MYDYAALKALAEIVETGSFERAAARLGVTPSAISQRIRQLEERTGAALLIRGAPCVPTAAGAELHRHLQHVAALEQTLSIRPDAASTAPAIIPIAVNADSLPTWFTAALTSLPDHRFDIVIDDQDHSAERLARGEVMGAVTAQAQPVRGCDSVALGRLRYRATASPTFVARWFADGVTGKALERAPMLTFSRKDRLQHRWIEVRGAQAEPPIHVLPDTNAFVAVAEGGLAWGLNPEPLIREALASGRLVDLAPDQPLDTDLHWQWPRRLATVMEPVTTAVRSAARAALHRPGTPSTKLQKAR